MDQNPTAEPTFEAALADLEELVSKMESGRLPLENMIQDYERGSKLLAFCRARIDAMERKIEILRHDDGGNGEWQDFDSATTPRQSGNLPL